MLASYRLDDPDVNGAVMRALEREFDRMFHDAICRILSAEERNTAIVVDREVTDAERRAVADDERVATNLACKTNCSVKLASSDAADVRIAQTSAI